MNQKNQAAVKKYGALKTSGANRAEVSKTIKDENKSIKATDLKIILDEIFKDEKASGSTTPAAGGSKKSGAVKKADAPKSPNDALDLTPFNYKKLTGKSFKDYVSLVGDLKYTELDEETGQPVGIVGQLQQNAEYDFVQLKAKPVMRDRFPGVDGTPRDYVGLIVTSDEPIHTSRMPIRVALEFNAQITNQHSMAGHGKYYFLKQ